MHRRLLAVLVIMFASFLRLRSNLFATQLEVGASHYCETHPFTAKPALALEVLRLMRWKASQD